MKALALGRLKQRPGLAAHPVKARLVGKAREKAGQPGFVAPPAQKFQRQVMLGHFFLRPAPGPARLSAHTMPEQLVAEPGQPRLVRHQAQSLLFKAIPGRGQQQPINEGGVGRPVQGKQRIRQAVRLARQPLCRRRADGVEAVELVRQAHCLGGGDGAAGPADISLADAIDDAGEGGGLAAGNRCGGWHGAGLL